jgi:hypothetical protein
MWVATDKDGRQRLFQREKPWRESYDEEKTVSHWSNWDYSLELKPKFFPDLKWEDEPIEVELVKKEKKGE